jgi:hypothetical protein
MKKKTPSPIFGYPAVLWDTQWQLSGTLELWEKELVFRLDAFQMSHLNWSVPLAHIRKVEEFLVFGLARNGLRIEDKHGKYDLFVLEEVSVFKKALLARI